MKKEIVGRLCLLKAFVLMHVFYIKLVMSTQQGATRLDAKISVIVEKTMRKITLLLT